MAAITLPEEIEPGDLLAYSGAGDDFLSVVAGGMPNGDDYLQVSHSTTPDSDDLDIWQPVRLATHMMRVSPDTNTMSFWIRRKANWDPSFSLLSPGSSSDSSDRGPILFGVGDPLVSNPAPNGGPCLGWAVGTYLTNGVQFYQWGNFSGTNCWVCSQIAYLTLDVWHLVVVNVTPWVDGNFGLSTTIEMFLDGVSQGTASTISASTYITNPRQVNLDVARFGIGDPSLVNNVAGRSGDGPMFDIGKLCFHNTPLTEMNQLNMIESMNYGGS